MHQLIYLSQATRPLSAKALTGLVEQAQQANAQQHLTGALVYGNKRFIQLLEGEQAALEQVYTRIQTRGIGTCVKSLTTPLRLAGSPSGR